MFTRLANLIRGFFGLFISGAERRNPEALLEVTLRKQRTQNVRKFFFWLDWSTARRSLTIYARLPSSLAKINGSESGLH